MGPGPIDLSLKPDLAAEWDVSSDGLEWTFKLQKGIQFHDGSSFGADDVVYSLNRHLGEDSISKVTSLVDYVSEWKKVDNHTVKAVLSAPNVDLPAILATFHFKIIKNDAENIDGYFQSPIGTGPFIPVEFTPGVRSVGRRNDNYFRGEVYLDEIELFAITDPISRVNALISGDVHLAAGIDTKVIKQVEAEETVELWSQPAASWPGICCMLDRYPGNNPDFVWAMKHMADRKRAIRSIMKKHGTIGNDHPIGAAYGADHCESLAQREADLDKAKFHLKKSGITEAEVEAAPVSEGIMDFCLLQQAQARKIGLDLKIKRVPTDGYWSTGWQQKPLNVTGWNMRPTANVMFSISMKGDAPWNDTYWANDRFDQLLVESRGVTDTGVRKEMYCEMEQLAADGSGVVLAYFTNYIDGRNKSVKGLTEVPLSMFGGQEWPDQVWLDT
ncbi:MAG: ABC transporter substrate-binding protein [Thiotrichales bacterium]|nr:ABC transporter substrate-binding protein [Thiotrichales bacterium]